MVCCESGGEVEDRNGYNKKRAWRYKQKPDYEEPYIKDDLIFYWLVWDPHERVKGENLLLLLVIILGQQQALTGTVRG